MLSFKECVQLQLRSFFALDEFASKIAASPARLSRYLTLISSPVTDFTVLKISFTLLPFSVPRLKQSEVLFP